MRESSGLSHSCPALKSFLSDKVGSTLCACNTRGKHKRQHLDIGKRMIESIRQRAAPGQKSFKSINSIIMKFPQFKEGLTHIKTIFEQYDKDSNETIDHEELKKCLSDLQVHIPDNEIDALYQYCDVDGNEGIQFNEFIVLLCLVYLLIQPATPNHNVSKIGSPKLEATFDTIVEAFSFLDKNGDGKLKRKEVMLALNKASPREKSPNHINTKRFKEMDCNKDGKVSFKEFLFALTKWVGFDSDDDTGEY